jgi:hypothetical protein
VRDRLSHIQRADLADVAVVERAIDRSTAGISAVPSVRVHSGQAR